MTKKRAKQSGGARPNAGRKKIEYSANPELQVDDPLEFMRAVMRDRTLSLKTRIDAAGLLLDFEDVSPSAVGKKKSQQAAAERTAKDSKFAPSKPPTVIPFPGKSA